MAQSQMIAPELTIYERLGVEGAVDIEICVGLEVEVEMFPMLVRLPKVTYLGLFSPIGSIQRIFQDDIPPFTVVRNTYMLATCKSFNVPALPFDIMQHEVEDVLEPKYQLKLAHKATTAILQ
jgi:hypothetical protein